MLLCYLMTQSLDSLDSFKSRLECSLRRGMEDFKRSQDYSKFVNMFDRLARAGFYEDDLREWLPNPAYDNAARRICEPFRVMAGELGLCLMKDTPGDWKTSSEVVVDGCEARSFLMPVYRDGALLGTLRLVFFHSHDRFDFPRAPVLEVVSEGIG